MKKLLIATTNPAKFQEIKEILSDLPLHLVSLTDCNIKKFAKEIHKTFKKNAIHKAKFYSSLSGLPTIADDGGLEIDYLNGLPGVQSRRWVNGTEDITDVEIVDYTLKKLQGIPLAKRTAKLKTVIALCIPGVKTYSATGSVNGVIAETPYKIITNGFPYRSLLYLPKIKKFYHKNEMTKEEIDNFNHRKKVIYKLRDKIVDFIVDK